MLPGAWQAPLLVLGRSRAVRPMLSKAFFHIKAVWALALQKSKLYIRW